MRGGACVANIQISDIKMPTLREVSVANNTKGKAYTNGRRHY